MIAVLHYLFLKSRRDQSLFAFIGLPILTPFAALLGATLAKGHLHYPFFMNPQFTPTENANLASEIATMIAGLLALLPAFWSLLPEVATRSVGSFFFAARPHTVTLALILFAFAIGTTSWAGGIAIIGAMTTALPSNLPLLIVKFVPFLLASCAMGALVVSISPQPMGVAVAYFAWAVSAALLFLKATLTLELVAAASIFIVCELLAGFLLERRCAT